MDLGNVRARYLVAMGFAAESALFAGCAGCKESEPTRTESEARAQAATAPSVTALAAPTVASPSSAAPAASSASSASAAPATHASSPFVLPPSMRGFPTCPHGTFCTVQPASVASGSAAPAPFAMCARTVSEPGDGPAPTSDAGGGERRHSVSFDAVATKSARDGGKQNDCCYSWVMPCAGGRALFLEGLDGAPKTTSPTRRDEWHGSASANVESLTPALRETLAAHWLAEAGAEHASIASFARTSLALMALGAPAALLRQTHEAALDEIRHAEACYAIASRYIGEKHGPAPISATAMAETEVTAFAVETFRAACVGETVAALVAKQAAEGARDPAIAAALAAIAADEDRHAALAWRTLDWAVGVGGRATVDAIAREIEQLFDQEPGDSSGCVGSTMDAHGVVSASEQRAIRRMASREIVAPCVRALIARHRAPRAAVIEAASVPLSS